MGTRRLPPATGKPSFCAEEDKVWRTGPWSIWCDSRRHADLLCLWMAQLRWYDNEVVLLAGAAEEEFQARFWDLVDVRAESNEDHAKLFNEAATSMSETIRGLLHTQYVVRSSADLAVRDEERPSAWQTSDVLCLALERVRPYYDQRLPAPRRRVWSVGADLTMCWVYTVALVHRDNYFTVPDPSDPYGLFGFRGFTYEDYLSKVDPDQFAFASEPTPDGDPFTWDWRPVNGPLGRYLQGWVEPWQTAAFRRVYADYL